MGRFAPRRAPPPTAWPCAGLVAAPALDYDEDVGAAPESNRDDEQVAGVPEVKVLTFKTMRTFLPDYFGVATCDLIVSGLSPETTAILNQPDRSEWVPEAHMHELMRRIYEEALSRDDEAYLEFARALAMAGINRFLKVFLSLASERFVLRKIPVVWQRLRRNAGSVTANVDEGRVRLEYQGFPLFSDRVYRLLSLANCQALVCAATQRIPRGRIETWSNDTLVLEFELGAGEETDAGDPS